MNAFVNMEGSCAAVVARYMWGSGYPPEVRRLQSMAQVGVDVFQTHLQIEEHQQVLERLKQQGRQLKNKSQTSSVEMRAVYNQAMDAEKQLATLRKSMQILETTLHNIENTAVMQRLHRVMQDTIARHQEVSTQNSRENTLHSEVTQVFDQLTSDVQNNMNSMEEMESSCNILDAQDTAGSAKVSQAEWFNSLDVATGSTARAVPAPVSLASMA